MTDPANARPWRVQPLAQEHSVVCESPDPARIFCYSPGLCRLSSGRLLATMDFGGPGVTGLPGPTGQRYGGPHQGRFFTSDNGGENWQERATRAIMHHRPFVAGKSVYVIGHMNDLCICRSDDDGRTWSDPVPLTDGEDWHQAPCNVWYANGCVYLVMERRPPLGITAWNVAGIAPVLMRGRLDADLTKRENWTFADELTFLDAVDQEQLEWFGTPFFPCPLPGGANADGVKGRHCAPVGWLETNVVQFTDPTQYWCDPSGKTFHLWMRANTGGTGLACVAKAVEQGDAPGTGPIRTMLETVPSGRHALFMPCPGGQMKFHIVHDEQDKLFWLLSTQARDSMTKAACLPDDRFNLPNNERRRLQLHVSRNCIDWCFAGLVAVGEVERASRHYASMVIDGDDLAILSRSGDGRASCPHNGNLITFHRVRDFRGLVY